jgi:hypothetical protein
MSISVHLEFPGGPSATVTCIGDPPSVPLLELIRIHAGKIKRTAVCRRFGDTAVTATVAETKALKAAGAVPPRSHNIRIVRLTALGAGVVSTVLEPEDSDSDDIRVDCDEGAGEHDADMMEGADSDQHDNAILEGAADQQDMLLLPPAPLLASAGSALAVHLPTHAESWDEYSISAPHVTPPLELAPAGSALAVHCPPTSADLSALITQPQSLSESAGSAQSAGAAATVSSQSAADNRSHGARVKDPNVSVDTILSSLHLPLSATLTPVKRWSLELVRHCVVAHVSAAQTYNVLRAAFGLVLFGATGKRKGTTNTICRDEDLLDLGGLFVRVPVLTGGRRAGKARFALQCVEWAQWLDVAEAEGFEEVAPLGAPPPLPAEDEATSEDAADGV